MAEEKTTDLDKWEKRHPEADILPAAQGPMEIMADAVRRGAGKEILEQLQGMFEFQKKIDADNARKAYYEAMSKFAANPPEIFKTKQVGYEHKDGKGSTSYKHAGLEDVAPKIQAHLSPHGLSASWVPDQTEKGIIKVTCKISHKDGHSESVSLSAPHDVSGKKNAIQAMASTMSYLERYTILALTGLATKDMDDDGIGSNGNDEVISDEQYHTILALLDETKTKEGFFAKTLKVESLDKMPASKYESAIKILEARRK